MATLKISQLNPIKFVQLGVADVPRYMTRHIDDEFHANRLARWQKPPVYRQPWTQADTVNLQIQSDAGVPVLKLINASNQSYFSGPMGFITSNTEEPTYSIYEAGISLTGVPDGRYFFEIDLGVAVLLSEPLTITSDVQSTLLFEYRNSKYFQNIIFETGFATNIRVHGLLRMKPPAARDTVYEDQVMDQVMLHSRPFRVWELIVGAGYQVTDAVIDKINRIMGCDQVQIDGKFFTKNESAKWEEADEIYFGSMKCYSIELRERYNVDMLEYNAAIAGDVGIFTFEFEPPFV